MSRSLNEISALCRRAARGAGFSYGEAEDAAFAVRWLAERGLDGPAALRTCLDCRDIGGCNDERKRCGLKVGAALLDACEADGEIGAIGAPLLMLPFLAKLAEMTGTETAIAGADGVAKDIATLAKLPDGAELRIATSSDAAQAPPTMPGARVELSEDDLARLMTFAARTYAPATDASRLSGAGAGLSDND